jgi:hypothetical protein
MPCAWLNLRHAVPERREAFVSGLRRCGYTIAEGLTHNPGDRDVLVTWNRIGAGQQAAEVFESRGRPVLVAENAAWGNDFAGGHWYSLASGQHNTAGRFPIGEASRWDGLGVDLDPFRKDGREVVILPQRGLGPPGVAMPRGWAEKARARVGGRIRPHPGTRACRPLQDDLGEARCVWTWGSGAAVKALLWGVPVHSEMPDWIGEQDNTDAGRLAMFRRLAWSQWRLSEIANGDPFARLIA